MWFTCRQEPKQSQTPETDRDQHGPSCQSGLLPQDEDEKMTPHKQHKWIHEFRGQRSLCSHLGSDVFQTLYEDLKQARRQKQDGSISLTQQDDGHEDSLQVDQLLVYEDELQRLRRLQDGQAPESTASV